MNFTIDLVFSTYKNRSNKAELLKRILFKLFSTQKYFFYIRLDKAIANYYSCFLFSKMGIILVVWNFARCNQIFFMVFFTSVCVEEVQFGLKTKLKFLLLFTPIKLFFSVQ